MDRFSKAKFGDVLLMGGFVFLFRLLNSARLQSKFRAVFALRYLSRFGYGCWPTVSCQGAALATERYNVPRS